MSFSSDEEFLLLDSVLPKLRKKRTGVHEINLDIFFYRCHLIKENIFISNMHKSFTEY